MRANFKDGHVQRGSFTTGRIDAADRLCASPSRVYRAFQKLQELGCITIKSNNRFTTVSVCNYDTYQGDDDDSRTADEQRKNNKRTTDGQPANNEKTLIEECKEGKKAKKVKDTPVWLPIALDTPEFRDLWSQWHVHRLEKRKPLTPTSVKQQLRMLERIGLQRAIATIEHTIAMGWEGLREPEVNGRPIPPKPPPAPPATAPPPPRRIKPVDFRHDPYATQATPQTAPAAEPVQTKATAGNGSPGCAGAESVAGA